MDDCPLQANVIEKNIPNMKKRACSLRSEGKRKIMRVYTVGLHMKITVVQFGKFSVSRVLCSSWSSRELPCHYKRQSSI